MNLFLSTLLDGCRATLLRRPQGASITAGAGLFFALIAVHLLAAAGIALDEAAPPLRLDPAGVSALLADALLILVAAWLLVHATARHGIVFGLAALLLAAEVGTALIIHWPLAYVANALLAHERVAPALLVDAVAVAWWFLVLLVIARWLAPGHRGRALLGALLAFTLSAAASWWLPSPPLLATLATSVDHASGAAAETADQAAGEDAGRTGAHANFDAEALMYDQPALLDAAIARLKPQTPGKIDLYAVVFAGDANEEVFRNEAEYAARLFEQRLDANGRVLLLQNNVATLATQPLATWTNLHRALGAIARTMDPAEDILLVYLTTHGSEDHQLLVDLEPLPLNQIEPVDLADALKTEPGMRWKVLVVNACYSGGFLDVLRDDSTMVITSARADRTSFGCGADAEITWFGKAFLADALNRTTSPHEAFELAKASVAAWERADGEGHSEPQIATSPSIEAKLAAWQRQLEPHPSVPFSPAPPLKTR